MRDAGVAGVRAGVAGTGWERAGDDGRAVRRIEPRDFRERIADDWPYLHPAMKTAVLSYLLILIATTALATSNYEYGADEYVTIAKGISPNRKYAITTHGSDEYGYDNFHVYLTNAVTGRRI